MEVNYVNLIHMIFVGDLLWMTWTGFALLKSHKLEDHNDFILKRFFLGY